MRWKMNIDPKEIATDTVLSTAYQSAGGERVVSANWNVDRQVIERQPDLFKNCIVELQHHSTGVMLLLKTSKGHVLGGGSCGPSPGLPVPAIPVGEAVELDQVFCRFSTVDQQHEKAQSESLGMKIVFRPIDYGK